jgi:hypothetical protein
VLAKSHLDHKRFHMNGRQTRRPSLVESRPNRKAIRPDESKDSVDKDLLCSDLKYWIKS